MRWQPVLSDDLLQLRPLLAADWGALSEAASDPLIWAMHPEPTRWQPEVFRRFFESGLQSQGALVVEALETGQIIGSSRFANHDQVARSVEIGWSFLQRAFWGGEYNRRMKALMLTHAFTLVDSVSFVAGEANLRSRRAIEKLGATLESSCAGKVVYRLKAITASM